MDFGSTPFSIIRNRRYTSVVVLPAPGTAYTAQAPFPKSTTSRCASVKQGVCTFFSFTLSGALIISPFAHKEAYLQQEHSGCPSGTVSPVRRRFPNSPNDKFEKSTVRICCFGSIGEFISSFFFLRYASVIFKSRPYRR